MLWGMQEASRYSGGRRHRFMESSDFNSAARHLFRAVLSLVDGAGHLRPSFLGLEIDPTTPGSIVASTPLDLHRPDIAASMALRKTLPQAVNAAFDHLQATSPQYALLGFICRSKDFGGAESNVYVELRSVDQRAVACFTYSRQAKRWKFAQLTILPPVPRSA